MVLCSTVGVLFCFMDKPAPLLILDDTPPPPACFTFDFEAVRLLTVECGIIVPSSTRQLRDQQAQYQGLRDYRVYPSLDAKSALQSDTRTKVVDQLLIGYAHADDTEVKFMLDTEYILSVMKIIYCTPQKMKNVFLVPPIFHIRMHVLMNLTNDPVYMVLIWCPFMFAIGEQAQRPQATDATPTGAPPAPVSTPATAAETIAAAAPTYIDKARAALDVCARFIASGERERGAGFSHKDKGSTSMNYARCQYLAQQLVAAMDGIQSCSLDLGLAWGSLLALDFISSGLKDLGIAPVAEIILDGNATRFVLNLHRVTQYLAHCHRLYIVRLLFVVEASLNHAACKRPDLLQSYFLNCTKCNDNIIENHNSATSHALSSNCLNTPELVARAAQRSEVKRMLLPQKEEAAGIKTYSSSKSRGEIYHEETRHLRGKGAADTEIIRAWLATWLLQFAAFTHPAAPRTRAQIAAAMGPQDPPPPRFRAPVAMDTIAGQLWDYPMAFKRAFLRARGQKGFTNLNTTKDAEDACRAAAATRATVNEFLQHQQQVDKIFDAQEVAAAQEVSGSSSYDGGDLGVCSEGQRD